ncbi:unnamed protein product [Rhizophagus irregularis]|nr:unnamed protein product [Rhizophagus irregularis]
MKTEIIKHLIFLIILASLLTANALQFSQCSGYYPNPANVSLLPDPPIFGQSAEIFISTIAYTTIEASAYVNILMSNPNWDFPLIYKQKICMDKFVHQTCSKSDIYYSFDYKFTYNLGNQTSALKIDIVAKLVNPDNNILSCINGTVTIQAPY